MVSPAMGTNLQGGVIIKQDGKQADLRVFAANMGNINSCIISM
jgi:hypothetical protein